MGEMYVVTELYLNYVIIFLVDGASLALSRLFDGSRPLTESSNLCQELHENVISVVGLVAMEKDSEALNTSGMKINIKICSHFRIRFYYRFYYAPESSENFYDSPKDLSG